jgi:hypothetical protein
MPCDGLAYVSSALDAGGELDLVAVAFMHSCAYVSRSTRQRSKISRRGHAYPACAVLEHTGAGTTLQLTTPWACLRWTTLKV